MKSRPHLHTANDLLAQLSFIRRKKQEYLICLSMDGSNRVIKRRVVCIGLLNMVPTHPRELFSGPVTDHAAYVIVAHNHPSGAAKPSKDDIGATQQLVAAGILLGIPVRDHYIVTRTSYFSFKQKGLI